MEWQVQINIRASSRYCSVLQVSHKDCIFNPVSPAVWKHHSTIQQCGILSTARHTLCQPFVGLLLINRLVCLREQKDKAKLVVRSFPTYGDGWNLRVEIQHAIAIHIHEVVPSALFVVAEEVHSFGILKEKSNKQWKLYVAAAWRKQQQNLIKIKNMKTHYIHSMGINCKATFIKRNC